MGVQRCDYSNADRVVPFQLLLVILHFLTYREFIKLFKFVLFVFSFFFHHHFFSIIFDFFGKCFGEYSVIPTIAKTLHNEKVILFLTFTSWTFVFLRQDKS